MIPNELLLRCVEAAIRAPSGDNCQPWAFGLAPPDRLTVSIRPDRAKSFFDFRHCGTFLSVGAVIENVRTQAAGDGFGTAVERPGGASLDEPAAVLRLVADSRAQAAASRVQAIYTRTVNRRPFLPRRASGQVREALLAESGSGATVELIDDRKAIGRWARAIYLADRIRYSHPVIHQELFARILFDRQTAQQARLGLEIDRLGAGPFPAALMRFLRPWDRISRWNRIGLARVLANHSRLLALSSGSLVLMTISATAPEDWIRAGETMQRLWLIAEERGLCVHPMTICLYLTQRYRAEGMENFLPEHEPVVKKMSDEVDELLQGRTGAMIFRLGRGVAMRDQAVRLPPEQFIRA